AEDGIRDGHVTGVQTCALPISADNAIDARRLALETAEGFEGLRIAAGAHAQDVRVAVDRPERVADFVSDPGREPTDARQFLRPRSEERRVGKECRARGVTEAVK